MTTEQIPAAARTLLAAVLAVRGTSRQERVSESRFRRNAPEAIANHDAIRALAHEIPRWKFRARRQRYNEIEAALADDSAALCDYRELRQELSAWNDLETVAALLFAVSVMQVIVMVFGD